MTSVSEYEAIHSINAELSGYRKGSLSVFIDLDKGYLTWRESTRWCNNFTRTITSDQIKLFRHDLEACRLLHWRNLRRPVTPGEPSPDAQSAFITWQVRIRRDGKAWTREGEDRLPSQWEAFCTALERLSRTSFRL